MAFEKLDKDGSGEVTASDLERCYDVTHNKDYQSGKKTKKQILQEFLNSYQVGPDKDEKVRLAFSHYKPCLKFTCNFRSYEIQGI